MLKILIVEDEPLLASTLKHLIEYNPRYRVTEIADDLASAVRSVETHRPDLALVDLQLARGSTGFSVAVKLNGDGIPCLFTTGKAPPFPMPDLALGCLMKPYSEEDLIRALRTAEDLLRGRASLRPRLPQNLQLYTPGGPEQVPIPQSFLAMPAMMNAGRASIRTRLTSWWSK